LPLRRAPRSCGHSLRKQAGNLASRRVLDKLGLRHLRDLRRHGAEQRWYETAAGEWRARSR
jgi:RimJ/RimL family protein N-acetyltransferase